MRPSWPRSRTALVSVTSKQILPGGSRPLRTRLLVSLALTVPLLLLAMVPPAQFSGWEWVALALATPIVLWAGRPFFVRGIQSVINRSPNMWTLIGLGVGAASLFMLGKRPDATGLKERLYREMVSRVHAFGRSISSAGRCSVSWSTRIASLLLRRKCPAV